MSPFLTVPEVAALLRVPESWIYEQSRQRRIPHYKGGKRLLFDAVEVLAWFKESKRRVPLRSPVLARSRPMLAVRRRRASGRAPGGRRASNRVNAGVSGDGRGVVAVTLPPETGDGEWPEGA